MMPRLLLLAFVSGGALVSQVAQPPTSLTKIDGGSIFGSAYRVPATPAVRWENSTRLGQLVRDGKLYLSLSDAIALGLENNLDVEIQRYGTRLADTDVLRAESGAFLRGVPLSVREGPQGLGGPEVTGTGTLGGGDTPILNRLTGPGTQTDLSILGSLPLSTGPAVPTLDPSIVGEFSWNHRTQPQTFGFLAGTSALVSRRTTANFGFEQGFLTGGRLRVGWDNSRERLNHRMLDYNPYTTSSLGLTFTQPLLRGFGRSVNNRYIRIAKNNRQVSDLVFQQQVISTVSAIVRLYWDLVSLSEDVKVRQDALQSAEQLRRNAEAAAEAGTAAKIEITRAEAELARRERDLSVARTLLRQQEAILKDYVSRGSAESLSEVQVVPTDRASIAQSEPIQPVADLVATALRGRPDLAQARLQIENAEVALKGSRSALLPSLDLVATVQNNGLAGNVNPLLPSDLSGTPILRQPDPRLTGGYGSALGQLFRRNFPDYGVGLSLSIPLRNRAARADLVRDQLSLRQAEIRVRQIEKQVRLEITNALIAVEQARVSYKASEKERILQAQTLAAEQEKFDVGASTSHMLIQLQRDFAAAQSAEASALSNYMKAKAALGRAVGSLLADHDVQLPEARDGQVSRASLPSDSSQSK